MQKILIIDDEESTRELLKLSLESDSYKVCTAEDGIKGLAVYETVQPDIVLTDIKMPGMDGIEVLRRLKQLNPEVEVVVITGHGEMELAIQALQLEASDFINKPISDQALSVALHRAKEKIAIREKLKEACAEIEKRYEFEHRLIYTSMDGIIANDPRGNIIIFNEGASRIYGYTRDEALSRLNVVQLYPVGVARDVKKHILSQEYGGPGRLINYETKALTRDGRQVPILLSVTVIYENDLEVATVGYFKDLTEIKELQQELLEKTRMAAIGQAMAEVAHGVKNILYGMQLGAFIVERGLAQEEMEKLQKGWRMVRNNMERISRLSLDMLSYARKEFTRLEPVSLNDVVNDVCESLAAQAEKRRIVIHRDLSYDLPCLLGNPEALHSCVLNLVTNALEAFPEDAMEGYVEVRTSHHQNADSMLSEGQVCLEVMDTGRGMTQEHQKKIFEPLFTTKLARGTGLGLAITQKIIGEHGGFIQVRSQLHQGSAFTVLLPVRKTQETL
jgi:PAS domain S-box-containing protein